MRHIGEKNHRQVNEDMEIIGRRICSRESLYKVVQ